MNELNITKNSKLFALGVEVDSSTPNILESLDPNIYDIIALKLNKNNTANELKDLLQYIQKPLMLYGTGDEEVDKKLLPKLIENLDRENCIIGNITERTYKEIIPKIIKGNHYAILKTPIDINLAKELNIIAMEDMGLSKNKIIMNTDIGGLGYGFEYGFSIMEKIIQERKRDSYLDFPIFSDASTESLKTKEATSDDYSDSYGKLEERKQIIELAACSGVIAAGANIIMVKNPNNIPILKGLV